MVTAYDTFAAIRTVCQVGCSALCPGPSNCIKCNNLAVSIEIAILLVYDPCLHSDIQYLADLYSVRFMHQMVEYTVSHTKEPTHLAVTLSKNRWIVMLFLLLHVCV